MHSFMWGKQLLSVQRIRGGFLCAERSDNGQEPHVTSRMTSHGETRDHPYLGTAWKPFSITVITRRTGVAGSSRTEGAFAFVGTAVASGETSGACTVTETSRCESLRQPRGLLKRVNE